MNKSYLLIAICLGFLAVVLGAFGAHSLKETITPEALQSFETGVRYQLFHAIVLLFINGTEVFTEKSKIVLSGLFFIGILLFSGSIYAISLGVDPKSIWFVTPLGGLVLLSAWFLMGLKVITMKNR